MSRYYNFETAWITLAESLKEFLQEALIRFEISDGRRYREEPMIYHFEILADDNEVEYINQWLDKNTITARS